MSNNNCRSANVTRNVTVSFVLKISDELLAFVTRTIFIYFLSAEYLGISSLFTNVLNVLNLAELGVGTAINVALYKPLAINDEVKVNAYLCVYKKIYRIIGLAVLVIGFCLLPFLQYFVNGTTDTVNIRYVFLLYLADSVCSYWLFAHKKALLEADQLIYIVNLSNFVFGVLLRVAQGAFLFVFRHNPDMSFYCFCSLSIFKTIANNIYISHVVNKRYTYLSDCSLNQLSMEEKKSLAKNVYGVALYKISSTVNNSADSIIISSFLGTILLGYYSNYLVLAGAVITATSMFFRPMIASLGNLNALESVEKKRFVYNTVHLAAFWIKGFCTISLCFLLSPFIKTFWLGEKYVLSEIIVASLCMNYLVDGLMSAPILFRDACGLYWQSRYRAVATVFVNIILSLIAVEIGWGIPGILLATILSRISITLWVDTLIVHKFILKTSPIGYFVKYFGSLFVVVATGFVIRILSDDVPDDTVFGFFFRLVLCFVVPNLAWYIIYHRTEEFKYLSTLVKSFFVKILRR